MATKKKMLTAVYQERTAAVEAYLWLQEHGYRPEEINVLMSDRTRESLRHEHKEPIKSGTMAPEGMAAGGAIGTALGATLAGGASLAGVALIGASIAIPGVGPVVAGPLYATLLGGGVGAMAGGVIGGLIGLGIHESNARAYEEALRRGGVIFGVTPHSDKDEEMLREYFEQHHADNVVIA
jgi:hypothetical protein